MRYLFDHQNCLVREEMKGMFKGVFEHLNPNGRFIFDMHAPQRLVEFAEEYIEEGRLDENIFYQWTIDSDKDDRTLNEHFTFYTPEGMIQEHHTQNVFDTDTVRGKMNKAGFRTRVIDDFIEDEKILVIGRKQ